MGMKNWNSLLFVLVFYLQIFSAFAGVLGPNMKSFNLKNLDLSQLRKTKANSCPLDSAYSYREAVTRLNFSQLEIDLKQLLVSSQDWWPADFGNYGPFFIRLSWHSSGTYRVFDGRGGANRGQIRFSPLGSWPDNVNLDKAKQLLWPIKQKYGDAVSWSDLIVLAGTVALKSMGLPTIGFAFGREDDWQSDNTNWGRNPEQLSSNKQNGNLETPFSATQMGLIYVNPEGPDGNPDRMGAAKDIRQAFSGMGMNDRQTVALIAGGHSFGKCHGAAPSNQYVGSAPNKAPIEQIGQGWVNSFGTGHGADTIGSGLQGSWTSTPTKWGNDFFNNLYNLNWTLTKSPGGAHQWTPTNETNVNMVPDAHKPNVFHKPFMLTTDLAMKQESGFNKYSKQFYENPKEFEKSFAEAWFKLTHRDMGPKTRYLGPWIPKQDFIWQDPVAKVQAKVISQSNIDQLKLMIAQSGLTVPELVRTAWASASTYRKTDYRGGSQGGRIALAPMKDWEINEPQKLSKVILKLKELQKSFNFRSRDGAQVSLADLIVLGGNVGIEQAALKTGYFIKVNFVPGRGDATQEQTDQESIKYLKSKSDGFINYHDGSVSVDQLPQALVQKANMLTLNVPQMTVLVGGLRALGVNYQNSSHGVLTSTPGKLDNSFFVKLLEYSTEWRMSGDGVYIGYDRKQGTKKCTGTPFDLMFSSHPELKAVAQFYAQKSNESKFLLDFVSAWNKVMMLGRFDRQ